MSPIPRLRRPGTFDAMSLRDIVDALIGPHGSGASRADPDGAASRSALDDAGHGELGPELFGEALVHYADTAPFEVADALAPIVVTASAVPLDRDLDLDLDRELDPLDTPTEHGDDGRDPDALDDTPAEVDPGDPAVDDAVGPHDATEEVEPAPTGSVVDDGFGRGSTAPRPAAETDDGGEGDQASAEPPTAAPVSITGLDEPTEPLVPVAGDERWLDVESDATADDPDGAADPDLSLDE